MDLKISYVLEFKKKNPLILEILTNVQAFYQFTTKNNSCAQITRTRNSICNLILSLIKQKMNKTCNVSNALKADISGKIFHFNQEFLIQFKL